MFSNAARTKKNPDFMMFSSFGWASEGYDSAVANQVYPPPLGNQTHFLATDQPRSKYSDYQEPFKPSAPLPSYNDQSCFLDSNGRDEMGLSAIVTSVQLPDPQIPIKVDEASELPGPKEKALLVSSSPLALLNKYGMGYNYFKGETLNKLMEKERDPTEGGRELSTEEIMRVAAAYFVQSADQTKGDNSSPILPSGLFSSGLTAKEKKNVVLATLLLVAADKVSRRQYEWARNLLARCNRSSSSTGNPVERVVYYFTEALQERITREIGALKRPRERGIPAEELMKKFLTNDPMKLVIQQKLPFSQLVQFTTIQCIIDNVASSTRIHMIDLSIKHGIQWTILMQALATKSTSPIENLKITAVGPSAEAIDMTRKSLVSFAATLGLPFELKAVIVQDMSSLHADMFEVDEEEAIGLYSSMDMNTLIIKPDGLENLMRVIQELKPCIISITDFEAKHNSPCFINRFTEALFFHSAFFDCLDTSMDRNDSTRAIIERSFCSEEIRSIVATEGRERIVRQVGIAMWRSFFARFGLVESELNEWSHYQASLLVKNFADGDSCTLDKNGKSLMIGWKGTPLFFISAWKLKGSGERKPL